MSEAVLECAGRPVAAVRVASPLLGIDGLAHSFGGLQVLRNVSLQVPPGGLVGLIGPNGSGKTTCFNIASGFLRPDKGAVWLDGRDITAHTVQQRSNAGLVRTFQTPLVFEQMSVLENLLVGCYKHTHAGVVASALRTGAARRELDQMRARAEACLNRFGLDSVRDTLAGELPAGQRRIVELARACIGQPRVLLVDEPSSGLNSEEIALLRHWLVRLNEEGMTILLVSHDLGLMTICSTVHALYFGEIIASGSFDALQADPRVREAYLGV